MLCTYLETIPEDNSPFVQKYADFTLSESGLWTQLPRPTHNVSLADSFPTGWPKSKFEICFGYNSECMHFWPYIGKAKMCLGVVSLFWEIVNKQLKIVNKQLKTENKLTPLKHILALPT